MFGSRSGVIFIKDTTPSTSTRITQTKIVSGFLTLSLDNIVTSKLLENYCMNKKSALRLPDLKTDFFGKLCYRSRFNYINLLKIRFFDAFIFAAVDEVLANAAFEHRHKNSIDQSKEIVVLRLQVFAGKLLF